ncbi:hypothetical protein J6590_063262 [Homalodisca vitripennis]|nr:hypothetical protein J6590_063262 [Homalodisca vitripennis]
MGLKQSRGRQSMAGRRLVATICGGGDIEMSRVGELSQRGESYMQTSRQVLREEWGHGRSVLLGYPLVIGGGESNVLMLS